MSMEKTAQKKVMCRGIKYNLPDYILLRWHDDIQKSLIIVGTVRDGEF